MRAFAGMAGAIAGGMLAITGATIGLMKHVADADLGFQLFALRMFMSTDSAKRLKIATDALGYSLDEISWNPELLARYNQLIEDQIKLQRSLGPEYEKQMKLIRGVEQQFDRLKVAGQYVAMGVVMNLAKAFGLEDATTKLDQFIDDFINNRGEISRWISDILTPIVKATGTAAKDTAEALLNMLGELVGDKSIQGPINLEKIKQGIKDIGTQAKETMADIGTMMKGTGHYGQALAALSRGDFGTASREFNLGEQVTREGGITSAPLAPTQTGRYFQQLWEWGKNTHIWQVSPDAPKGVGLGQTFKTMPWFEWWPNRDITAMARSRMSQGMPGAPGMDMLDPETFAALKGATTAGAPGQLRTKQDVAQFLISLADQYRLPRDLVLGIAMQESHLNPKVATGSAGEVGLMQMKPSNWAAYGITDPANLWQTGEAGVKLLYDLYYKSGLGSREEVVSAYNEGIGKLRKYGITNPEYVSSVEGHMAEVGDINVTVNVAGTSATADDIKNAAKTGALEAFSAQSKRAIARQGGSY